MQQCSHIAGHCPAFIHSYCALLLSDSCFFVLTLA